MIYAFDAFELDTGLFELRRGGEPCPLEPQVFTVLAYLVEHHDRVVTKTELMEHVWGDRFISEAALTSRLMAARKALGDSGQQQRYIKTVHGRGYRFVGDISDGRPAVSPGGAVPMPPGPIGPEGSRALGPPGIFGRDRELAHLSECFEAARAGRRTAVFVTGEAGMGKSTLIEAFIHSLGPRAGSAARLAVGHCIEQRGVGEPYMSAIEALASLCRSSDPVVQRILMTRAPTWLLQVPWLLTDADLERIRERALGNTSERMLREAADAIEELSQDVPLVLILEDLHWVDRATLDLIDWLGRRKEPARFLLIGSYRPGAGEDAGIAALQRELRVRGLCHELALPLLHSDALEEYLRARFAGLTEVRELGELLLRRTDGNPLFARAIVDAWEAGGALESVNGRWLLAADVSTLASAVPDSLRGLIQGQYARVPERERPVLEVAAVVGTPFSSAAIGAVLGESVEDVERTCESLRSGGGMLTPSPEPSPWPGMDSVGSYAFVHSLYEETVYQSIPSVRRARLHQEAGVALERAAGADAQAHATELARHFRQGGDAGRAIYYLRAAADQAMFRGAHREATDHLGQAMDLLPGVQDAGVRQAQEAELQSLLAGATIIARGFGAPDAERAYKRALELTGAMQDPARRAGVVFGLAALLEYQARHGEAGVLLQQLDDVDVSDREIRIPYHALRSCSAFHQGMFPEAIDHGEAGLRLQQPDTQNPLFAFMGEDPMLGCREWSGQALWFIGFPDSAVARMEQLLKLAKQTNRRYAYASALGQAARLHQLRIEPDRARIRAEEATAVAEEYGFTYHLASGRTVFGWALVATGERDLGLRTLQEGLDLHEETGAQMDRPYYLGLLADAKHRAGALDEAIATLEKALGLIAQADAPFFYEAELRRLLGEIMHLAGSAAGRAEDLVRQSIAIARRQDAPSLELRAAATLVSMLGERALAGGEAAELKTLLERFTEGHATVDQVHARRVLDGAHRTVGRRGRPSRS